MGNPYWMGMMMGHAWNLLILGLGIGMGLIYPEDTRRPELTQTAATTTNTTSTTTKRPLSLSTTTTTTIDDDQMLAEILGITISVGCTNGKEELSPITCGSGYKCDTTSCGIGAKPVPATITQRNHLPGGFIRPYDCDGICKRETNWGSQCKSVTNVPCSANSWLESFCDKYVTIKGSDCTGVYNQINFYGGISICLDFCCYCPSVFRSCKCNCCKCLDNTGGTCGSTACNISCPKI